MVDAVLRWCLGLLTSVFQAFPEWHLPTISGGVIMPYLVTIDYLVPILGVMRTIFGLLAFFPVFMAARFTLIIYSAVRGGGPQ